MICYWRKKNNLYAKITGENKLNKYKMNYRGEVCVIIMNLSDEPFEIKQGDRIAQAVLTKYTPIEWETTTTLEASDRGENGFGSSGV